MDPKKKYGFATLCIHGKKRFDKPKEPPIRSLSTPIYQSSTFFFDSAEQAQACFEGKEEGYIYTRLSNPTQTALETEIAYLEDTDDAIAFGSGMAAISTTVLSFVAPGENIVSADTVYGGTHALFVNVLPKIGIEVREVCASNLEEVKSAIDDKTKMLFMETPANPTLRVYDIEAFSKIAKEHNLLLTIDNTFMTPYYQNPIQLGANIVIHSATKYLGGHGDTVAGIVAANAELCGVIRENLIDYGGIISPFNAWLILRGLKTLPVRMERHTENATEIAKFLSFHPRVESVSYPGLRTHPDYEIAKRQMRGAGGMLCFELKGGREAGRILLNNVEVCALAVSLGDVDTLIEHPATMTHSTYSAEDLQKAGISEGLVRISVGLEDVDDLIEDLRQALDKIP